MVRGWYRMNTALNRPKEVQDFIDGAAIYRDLDGDKPNGIIAIEYIEQLEAKEKLLNRNLEKQKGLYEVFSEDKINLDIYKERAELLRNEEKKLKSDIKAIQLNILEKRNAVNLTKITQDFLLRLKNTLPNEQSDYMIKSFMRIIFKGIYVQNQEIVKVDINQPWKLCYEEGLKWLKQAKTEQKPEKKARRSYVSFCVPSDVK